ncbi:MAG: 1-acyl-sn-glycerol-3-phosphate acyltransferase [Clostridia bacterium]|nr:1-acyl-sn-glycerol-3-phosphate acyltransferase [Clostridia bacterium]
MNKDFFDKDIQEQLHILENENFFNKNELAQIDFLRNLGFFEIDINKRIQFLENAGLFHLDVNDDPPTVPLTLDQVDYLTKKIKNKINRKMAYSAATKYIYKAFDDHKLIIKDVIGIENLQNLDTGAIITCNHFNPFDVFTLEKIFRDSGEHKKRRLYKVIREGNYTNFPGLYGMLFRNCDTLPLASNKSVMVEFMKSISIILKKKNYIIIYPEQSMWLNYKKPKLLQPGAFKIAVKNKCPIIPIFITMEDSEYKDDDGSIVQAYTVNIGKPIYSKDELSDKENCEFLKSENYSVWKKIYEDFYKTPLEYSTEKIRLEALNGR